VPSVFRFLVTIIAVLIFVSLPDSELAHADRVQD
jgi:predicted small integral membrane protein